MWKADSKIGGKKDTSQSLAFAVEYKDQNT